MPSFDSSNGVLNNRGNLTDGGFCTGELDDYGATGGFWELMQEATVGDKTDVRFDLLAQLC
jgi:hypothetical protein